MPSQLDETISAAGNMSALHLWEQIPLAKIFTLNAENETGGKC